MSERDSDRDARWAPWRDEPGASVFDRPGGDERPGGSGAGGPEPGGGPGRPGGPGGAGWPGWSGDERTQAMPDDGGGAGAGWPPPQQPGAYPGPPGGQIHIPAPPEPPPEVPTRPDAGTGAPPTQAYGQAPGGYAPPYDPTPGYEQWPGDPGPGQGPGYGAGPGPGPGPGEGRRHRPRRSRGEGRPGGGDGIGFPFGLGALLGVAGLVGVLLSLLSLPWFTVAGQDVALSDIRTAYEAGDEAPGTEQQDPAPEDESGPTLPEDVTSPGDVGDAVRDEVSNAAGDAAAAAVDSGKARYLELYVERLWLYVAIGTGLAVLFSTILAPRSFALGLLLGFRRLSGFVTLVAAGAHGAALWILFTGEGSPEPTTGVGIGVAGFVGVFAGCVVGPKR